MKSKNQNIFILLIKSNNQTNCRSCFCVINITLLVILLEATADERDGNITFLLESIKLSNILDTQF